MSVHVLDLRFLQPGEHGACLSQVNQVDRQRSIRFAAHAKRQCKCAGELSRAEDRGPDRRHEQRPRAVLQDKARARSLAEIFRVYEAPIPATYGHAQDVEALVLNRLDFTSHEAVADLGILIDKVRDPGGRRLRSWIATGHTCGAKYSLPVPAELARNITPRIRTWPANSAARLQEEKSCCAS